MNCFFFSPDGLVRHLGLEDDRQGDPWCGEGSWREDQDFKKDVKEVEEHLNNFVAIAEAMQLHKANKWSFLAQYSINKMCADLCAMAADVVFHF